MSSIDSSPITPRAALLALACLCVLTSTGTRAETRQPSASPQAAIEARQQGFKKMGAAMKVLTEQSKSDAPDLTKMATAAQTISSTAQDQFRWFPAGTGPDAGIETDALDNIWQAREKFDSLSSQLIAESKTLTSTISSKDPTAIKAQVKAVGGTCSSCHRSFRAD